MLTWRTGIAFAAETECAIAKVTDGSISPGASVSRPSTTATTKNLEVSDRLPKLLSAIDAEKNYPEDKFQAQVCVAWLHWVVAEYSLATVRLPKPLNVEGTPSEWTDVCALKAAYIKANCLTRNYQRPDSLIAFQAGLEALDRIWVGRGVGKQMRYWAELLLTEYCMLASQALQENETSFEDPNVVACFRAWAKFWSATSKSASGGYGFKGSVPRRRIWSEYYLALSRILEDDLPLPAGQLENISNESSARSQLRAELKNVEAVYQALLMGETTFPRADEERSEVESFVKLVLKNWTLLCGRGWREQDLGPGGRSGLSRGLLDILYAAAAKTFHSAVTLRALFVVHLSVAEFDVAFKAFDSYLEIIKKGQARVEKTGQAEAGLDDDATVLHTMGQCVHALCQYGRRQSAEKAHKLGAELEDRLAKLPQMKTAESGSRLTPESDSKNKAGAPVPTHIIALSWQAIGTAHAHWSRATYDAASRTEIQAKALRCLRRSLAADLGRSKDVRSFMILGVLLAERREITAAIEVVRTALMANKASQRSYSLLHGQYWLERSLVPMWHLLALLLSARQDYVSAARACEGAFEQFQDPNILFGQVEGGFRSEHLNDAEAEVPLGEYRRGLVDDMDDSEKMALLEVKMTQLSLVELMEGPEVAVNASYELLTLFSRLFGKVSSQRGLGAPPTREPPPKTSGTLRSIKGSILGSRSDRSRPPSRQPSAATTNERPATLTKRPATAVTAESSTADLYLSVDSPGGRRESPRPAPRRNLQHKSSLKKRSRSLSRKGTSSGPEPSQQTTVVDGDSFFTPTTEGDQSDFFTFASRKQQYRISSFSRGRTLPSLNSFLSSNSKSTDYSELSVEDTHSSADMLPPIQFPKDKEKMRRARLLVRVWLMIAGFYRNACMYEDCKAAVSEARELVEGLETEVARDPHASTAVNGAGWAEFKSIDDLWGDVWAEVSKRGVPRSQPRMVVPWSLKQGAVLTCC